MVMVMAAVTATRNGVKATDEGMGQERRGGKDTRYWNKDLLLWLLWWLWSRRQRQQHKNSNLNIENKK